MSIADRICTIVAHNYVAQARVLAASVAEHSPASLFSTLLIDGTDEDRGIAGIGEVVLPTDLALPDDVLASMRLTYDVMEYATALKPALLMFLLRRATRTATYLDPDIRLYADIEDVRLAAVGSGIAITPHTLEPLPRDQRMLNEAVIMHAGIYNLGFVATSAAAYRFLAWWHDRLRTDAVVDLQNALFTDQRWMDWAPALASPSILRDKGLNVAYWNLHERPVKLTDARGWTAGGAPLRFFHFSGYDPARPEMLSKHQGPTPRTLLSEHDGLRQLCDAYGAELVAAGHIDLRRERYRLDALPSGLRLTALVRRLCRDAILGLEPALGTPPDPWQDESSFLSWLLDATIGGPLAKLSRFEYGLWRMRPDLRAAFPDPLVAHGSDFRTWLTTSPDLSAHRREAGLGQSVTPVARVEPSTRRAQPLGGWSIVGYARAELGVGEAGRRVARAFAYSGLPWEVVGLTVGPLSRQDHAYRGQLSETPGYANQVLCVNADQTPRTASMLGPRHHAGRRIGYWFWELDEFPSTFAAAFDHVDEIWVSSEFNRAAIARATDKRVSVLPLPAAVRRAPSRFTRAQLGLPEDRFVFLVNFDYLSVLRRKNPLGAIEAYMRAFGPDDGTTLVIKSINGHHKLLDRERVRIAAAGRPDIVLLESYLSAEQVHALTASADCVLSLHRSEGFGLNLLDAMQEGTPVIATGYSGNMQFMDERSAFLVPYELTQVGNGAEPYSPTARWAEPDLSVAVAHMHTVVGDEASRQAVVAAAYQRLTALDPARIGERVRELALPQPHLPKTEQT